MIRTPRRLALTGGLALLLLTGCGDGEVRPGAAAVVGEQRIAVEELQQIADRGLADPAAKQQLGSDVPGFQRTVLTRLIERELLEVAAAAEGVTVTDGDVAAEIADLVARSGGDRAALEAEAAQAGIAAQDIPPFVRDILTKQALGAELTEDVEVPREDLETLYQENIGQYDQVRTRHILVEEEKVARTILGNVQRDRTRFPALAAQFSLDTSNKDQGGELPLTGRGRLDPPFENAVFAAEEGDLLVVQSSFGWHVVEVLERQTTTLQEALPELRSIALGGEQQEAVQRVLVETAEEVGVNVNPRFGRWDSESAQVVPVDSPNGVLTPAPGSGGVDAPQGEQPQGEPPAEQPQGEPVEPPADPAAPAESPAEPAEPAAPAEPPAEPAASPAG